jgi:hypothetical protein
MIMAYCIPSKELAFIHIPKTGGTSILKWLEVNFSCEKMGGKHIGITVLREKYFNAKVYFTCVRNPYSRMLSWFHYQAKMSQYRVNKNKPRSHDVEFLEVYKNGFNHWLQQEDLSYLMTRPFVNPQVDFYDSDVLFVLKTETLNKDFVQVQEYLNCFKDLEHLNTSKSNDLDYRSVYDEKSKKIVYKMYEKDFDILKYTF